MYYALTINGNTITGVHGSLSVIEQGHFALNSEFANDTVIPISGEFDYVTGMDIRCYNEDGTMKSEVWCIEQGYLPLPSNKEIINGELVDIMLPPEQQPITIVEFIRAEIAAIKDEQIQAVEAVRVEHVQKIDNMKPLMTELVKDKPANIVISANEFILDWEPNNYVIGDIRRDGTGYPKRCITAHNSLTNPEHTIEVASLWAPFHATREQYTLPWIAPTGAHDMYKSGEYMLFTDEKYYLCVEGTNFSPVDYPAAWHVKGLMAYIRLSAQHQPPTLNLTRE